MPGESKRIGEKGHTRTRVSGTRQGRNQGLKAGNIVKVARRGPAEAGAHYWVFIGEVKGGRDRADRAG